MPDIKKRPSKTKPGRTAPRQFRLEQATLDEMDFLKSRLGLASRSAVIRQLVRKAAIVEGFEEKAVQK